MNETCFGKGEYLQTKTMAFLGVRNNQKLSPVNGGFCEGKLQNMTFIQNCDNYFNTCIQNCDNSFKI